MKIVIAMVLFFGALFGGNLQKPLYSYKIESGIVSDVLYSKERLYIATDDGVVDVFDTKSHKKVDHIVLEKVKDFMGDVVESKIFTLDMLEDTLLILSQDSGGYSRVHLYKDGKLQKVVSSDDHFSIIKAKFIDKESIVMALISNDILSYNIKTKKQNWSTQASMSKFSSFALNEKRDSVAVVDESGDVHILDLKDGKNLQKLSGENVDNIFSVDYKNGVVITGGQDRRVGVYNLMNKDHYYKAADFFVYGVGLSPSGAIGAYSCDMDNNVALFYTATKEPITKVKGTKMVVNGIYFINEKEFFLSSSAKSVGYYKIK